MKKIMKLFAGLLVLLSNIAAFAQSATKTEKSLLWQISGKGLAKPSYLFGTIHLICSDDYFWTDAMKQSFNKSDNICLEMDLDDDKLMANAAQGLIDESGKKLSEYFTNEQYKLLSKYVKDSFGMSILLFESMKPIALQTLFATKSQVCETQVSYEEKMVAAAKDSKKEVMGLETPDEQFTALESIPLDSVVQGIMDIVQNKTNDKDIYEQMVAAYKAQDIDGLQKMIAEGDEFGGATGSLLDNRNKKWISRMATMMTKSSVFFAVGAGHLSGDNGVITLLRKQGYSVVAVK